MSERQVGIYVLTHTASNTAYVGSALNPKERISTHIEGNGARCTYKWIADLTPKLPSFRIRDWCDESDRVLVEEAWIYHYAYVLGYRLVNGTQRVWPIDTAACRKGAHNQSIEAKRKGGRKGGLAAQATLRRRGVGLYDPKVQSKGGRSGTFEARSRAGKKGTRNGGHLKVLWDTRREFMLEQSARAREDQNIEKNSEGKSVSAVKRGQASAAQPRTVQYYKNKRKGGRHGIRVLNNLYPGLSNHTRYHTNCDIFKPTCVHCLLNAALNNEMKVAA